MHIGVQLCTVMYCNVPWRTVKFSNVPMFRETQYKIVKYSTMRRAGFRKLFPCPVAFAWCCWGVTSAGAASFIASGCGGVEPPTPLLLFSRVDWLEFRVRALEDHLHAVDGASPMVGAGILTQHAGRQHQLNSRLVSASLSNTHRLNLCVLQAIPRSPSCRRQASVETAIRWRRPRRNLRIQPVSRWAFWVGRRTAHHILRPRAVGDPRDVLVCKGPHFFPLGVGCGTLRDPRTDATLHLLRQATWSRQQPLRQDTVSRQAARSSSGPRRGAKLDPRGRGPCGSARRTIEGGPFRRNWPLGDGSSARASPAGRPGSSCDATVFFVDFPLLLACSQHSPHRCARPGPTLVPVASSTGRQSGHQADVVGSGDHGPLRRSTTSRAGWGLRLEHSASKG